MGTLKKNGVSNASIIEALAKVGVTAAVVETIKNNVVYRGFQIDNGTNVKPVVYYSSEETLEAFVEKVLRIADQPVPEIDANNLVSKERLLCNSILCIQKKSDENLVKQDYLNLELYVRVLVDFPGEYNQGSIKVNPQILDQAGLTEYELLHAARKNSIARATIGTMAEALGVPEELFGEVPFFVGTYEDKCHGAAILALPEVIHDFCKSRGLNRILCIPSSTEEALFLPADISEASELSAMVNEVNSTTVDPVLQLDPVVYLYNDETQEVTIASSYREEV